MEKFLQGRYRIQRQLGNKTARTGQQTFLAIDQTNHQPVVIKLLRFGPGFEWEHLRLFQREANILKALDHPAIPQYLDSFELETPQYKGFALVQTYIDACSLEEHLQNGRAFAKAEIIAIARQLLDILTYLHGHHPPIIHRDIKPSNVLLRDRTAHSVGTVCMVDFGSVQNLVAIEGGTITVVGTYGYMPPEQFGGRAVPASDLYSLGATVIYLLTGTHPADLPQQDLRICFEDAVSLDNVLKQWIRKLIEPSLEKRFDRATAALKALQHPEQWTQSQVHRFRRPVGSFISLIAGVEELVLTVPSPYLGRGLRMPPVNVYVILCLYFVTAINPIFSLYLFVPWVSASLGSRMLLYLISLLLEKQLIINSRTISIQYSILKYLPIWQHTVSRSKICLLEVVHDRRRRSEWDEHYVKGEIIIWAGNYAFRINKLTRLTIPETRWIVQELGDWLGLTPTVRSVEESDKMKKSITPNPPLPPS